MTRFERIWNSFENSILAVLAVSALAMVCFEVFARYWMPSVLPDWGAEVIMYFVVTAVLISGNQLVLTDRHIRADLFVQKLPAAPRRMIDFVILLIGFLYCAVVSWFSVEVVTFAHLIDIRSDSSLQFKQWIFYLVLPIAFGLMAIRYLIQIVRFVKKGSSMPVSEDDKIQDRISKAQSS